jgi:beta-1,2-mannobiose phosphorylase / 1,2-beta-oligomannan phosphorylase
VNAVFNPGVAIADGQTVLLCRVEDRRGISHLTIARSPDGINDWRVDSGPFLAGDERDPTSRWGTEDPRITRMDEVDGWFIAYTAYGPAGPCVALAVTRDFHTVDHIGVAMPPEDKNASLLPRHIDGQYVLFHRPSSQLSGRADIWLSRSTDLRSWTHPEPVLSARSGAWWDSVRVGMGPPPLETSHGWLGIYHGVRHSVTGPVYRAGLVLLDLENPAAVLRRSDEWVLAPLAEYERCGDVPNVVFPTGLAHDPATNELRLYYGAADTSIAVATARLDDVLDYVLSCPSDGHIADF